MYTNIYTDAKHLDSSTIEQNFKMMLFSSFSYLRFKNMKSWRVSMWIKDEGTKDRPYECGIRLERPSRKPLYVSKLGRNTVEAMAFSLKGIKSRLLKDQIKKVKS